ncbi:MAG: hypothetical protein B6229_02015 [Spirochaetaceae bacterium 4572_7]|nr:MAG: hypothetical protein B6229_02015 [Spirochaetaceae bacterium 4572_7]
MKQIILLLLIILLSTTFVYSRGNSELSQIDIAKQLLEEKKYNEAIAVLTTYMSKNPSTIYEVQTLLDEIKDKREVNNTIMNDLITAIFDDENYDKGFELIKELEKNDPYPDELSKLFLRDAREGATFVINKKAFNNYMDQALEHLNNDEFTEALDLYLLCLDFHADEFDLLMTSNQNSILEVDLNSFDEDKPVDGYYLSLKNSSKKEIDLIKDETIGLKELIVQYYWRCY